jgi:peptide/nickel transport system substrate-binding protein
MKYRSLSIVVLVLALMSVAVRAQEGKTLVIGWAQEANLPSTVVSATFSAAYDNFYNRGLFMYDTERNVMPVMAASIPSIESGDVEFVEVEGDFLGNGETITGQAPVVTLKLNPGMVWSDGKPITSADIKFTSDLLYQPDPVDSFTSRGDWTDVVNPVEVIDELTVKFTFKKPFADWFLYLLGPLPSHKFLGDNGAGFTMDTDGDGVFDANFDEAPYNTGMNAGETIGYGPYVVGEYVAGTSITFDLNPNWGMNAWEKVPAFSEIVLVFIPETEQMKNSLQVGDIDLAWNFSDVATIEAYTTMENVGVFGNPGVYEDAIWFNIGPDSFPAIQDVNVRKAMAAAINRVGIAEAYAPGIELTKSWYPRQYVSDDVTFIAYDVAAAREGLTAAGWVDADADESDENARPTPRVSQGVEGVADGTPFVLKYYTTVATPRPDVQALVQADLAKVGIVTQTFAVPGGTVLFAAFNQRGILSTGDFDIAMYALSSSPLSPAGAPANFRCDGIPTPEKPDGQNNVRFCDPEYDQLDKLQDITTDPVERLATAQDAIRRWVDATFWLAIRPRPDFYAVRTDRLVLDSVRDMGNLSSNFFQRVEYWEPGS